MDARNERITINDVARELGVSTTTISRVLSGKGRISESTRKRVMDYINEHDYTPNAIAKSLAQSKTYNIGWVIPGGYSVMELPFFQNCLMGVVEVASANQYDILLSMVIDGNIDILKRAVINNKIDGAIIARTSENDEITEYLLSRNVPFVTVGLSENDNVIQIDNNHEQACMEMTAKLYEAGARDIALIGGDRRFIVNRQRLNGYKKALESLGLPYNPDKVILDCECKDDIKTAVDRLIGLNAECIVCMDDAICMTVYNKLKKDKISIPSEIKLASFYNSPQLESCKPRISAIDYDAVEVGNSACGILIDCIDGREVNKKTLLGYKILMKDSTK